MQRDEIIEEHFKTTKPTVLISQSLHLGLDLKDDLSRFQEDMSKICNIRTREFSGVFTSNLVALYADYAMSLNLLSLKRRNQYSTKMEIRAFLQRYERIPLSI